MVLIISDIHTSGLIDPEHSNLEQAPKNSKDNSLDILRFFDDPEEDSEI